jgi:transglutaminase-like putative cysteine protease
MWKRLAAMALLTAAILAADQYGTAAGQTAPAATMVAVTAEPLETTESPAPEPATAEPAAEPEEMPEETPAAEPSPKPEAPVEASEEPEEPAPTLPTAQTVAVDGQLLHLDENGDPAPLEPGLQLLDDGLYLALDDGSLAMDTMEGLLYFGPDGRYTSGSEELDILVEQALADCTTPDMSREEMLRASYDHLRDDYKYLNQPHCDRGTTDWTADYALFMLDKGKGNCYNYAAVFTCFARRLGYEAQVVSGAVASDLDHAWVMIDDRLYDPEMEYAYRYRYADYREYDLFAVSPDIPTFDYQFPD